MNGSANYQRLASFLRNNPDIARIIHPMAMRRHGRVLDRRLQRRSTARGPYHPRRPNVIRTPRVRVRGVRGRVSR